MHELSILQDTLELAQQQLLRHGKTRIHSLTLRVGALAGVDPIALRFAFDVTTRGTNAEGALLFIEEIPITIFCSLCKREFQPQEWDWVCPHCGTVGHQALSGKELELRTMEVS